MEDNPQGRGRARGGVKVIRPKMIRDLREGGHRGGRGRGKMRWGGGVETPGEVARTLSEPMSLDLGNLSLVEDGDPGDNNDVVIPQVQMFEEDSEVFINLLSALFFI